MHHFHMALSAHSGSKSRTLLALLSQICDNSAKRVLKVLLYIQAVILAMHKNGFRLNRHAKHGTMLIPDF